MACRGQYHRARFAHLVKQLMVWREQRVPGPNAFQSNYDRYADSEILKSTSILHFVQELARSLPHRYSDLSMIVLHD